MDRNNRHVTEIMLLEMSHKPLSRVTEAADTGVVAGAKPVYKFEGPCAEFGVTNENYRKYSKDDYMKKVAELIPKINENDLMGELDHRDEYGVQMKTVSHLITGLRYDESSKQVMIQIELLDTDEGRKVMAIADRKIPIHISSRASGYIDDDGNVELERIYTYDIVSEPGFKNARLKRLNESLHIDSKFIGIYEWKDVKDKGNTKNEAQAQAVDVNNILNIVRKEMASGMGVIKNSITEVKKDIIKMQTSAKHVNIGRIPRAIREDAQETPSKSPEQTKDDFVTRMQKIDPDMTEDNSDAEVTMYKNSDGKIIGQWWNEKNTGNAVKIKNPESANESKEIADTDMDAIEAAIIEKFGDTGKTIHEGDLFDVIPNTTPHLGDNTGESTENVISGLKKRGWSVEMYDNAKMNESVEISDADIDAIEAGLIEKLGDTGKTIHEDDLFSVVPNVTPHIDLSVDGTEKPIIAALKARGWSVEVYENIRQVIDHVNKLGRNFNKLVQEVDGGDVSIKAIYEYVDGIGKSINKAWDYITIQTNTINKLIDNQNLSRPKEIREALACIKGLKKISESLIVSNDSYIQFVVGKIKAIKTIEDVNILLDEAKRRLNDSDYISMLSKIGDGITGGNDVSADIDATVKHVSGLIASNSQQANENADTARSVLKTAGYISDEEDEENNDYTVDGNDLICNSEMTAKTLCKHLKKNGHQCDINGNTITLLEARDVEILRLKKIVESMNKSKPKKRVNEGHSDIEWLTNKCKEYGITQEDTDFLVDDCGGDISAEMAAQIKNICLNAKHGGEEILEYFGYDVPSGTYESKIGTGSIIDITEGRLKGKKAIVTNKIIGKNKAFEGVQAKVNGRIINIPASAVRLSKLVKESLDLSKLEKGKTYWHGGKMDGEDDTANEWWATVRYDGKDNNGNHILFMTDGGKEREEEIGKQFNLNDHEAKNQLDENINRMFEGNVTPDKLEIGKKYRVSSGMGGAFNVKYNGKVGDKHEFQNVHPGYEKDKWSDPDSALYHYSDGDIPTKISEGMTDQMSDESISTFIDCYKICKDGGCMGDKLLDDAIAAYKEKTGDTIGRGAALEIVNTKINESTEDDSHLFNFIPSDKKKLSEFFDKPNGLSPSVHKGYVFVMKSKDNSGQLEMHFIEQDMTVPKDVMAWMEYPNGELHINENKLNNNTADKNKYSTQVLSERVDLRIDSLNKQKDEARNAEMVKNYPFLVLVKEDAKVLFGGLPTARKKLIGQMIINSKNKSADFITETIHLIATKNDKLLEFESKLSDKQLKIWENVERKVQKHVLASYNTREINDETEMTAFFESLDLRPMRIEAPDEAQPERPINESNYSNELGYNDRDIEMMLGLNQE